MQNILDAISTCIEEAVFEERQRAGFSILLDTEVEEEVGNGWKNPGPSNKLLYARCNKRAANGPRYRYYERDDNFDCRTSEINARRRSRFE